MSADAFFDHFERPLVEKTIELGGRVEVHDRERSLVLDARTERDDLFVVTTDADGNETVTPFTQDVRTPFDSPVAGPVQAVLEGPPAADSKSERGMAEIIAEAEVYRRSESNHATFTEAFVEGVAQLMAEGGGTLHCHAADCEHVADADLADRCPCRPVAIDVCRPGTVRRLEVLEAALAAVATAHPDAFGSAVPGLWMLRVPHKHYDASEDYVDIEVAEDGAGRIVKVRYEERA